ncbi:MAG TPA: hypothetical protein ENI27_07920 [bacterium]|nr:hypothetical protein [bacterium]
MIVSTKSIHYKWGHFFWRLSLERNRIKQPQTLCSYFWVWLVFAPFAPLVAVLILLVSGAFVTAIFFLVLLGPLAFGVWFLNDPNMYIWEDDVLKGTINTAYWISIPSIFLQAIIWWTIVRKMILEKSFFPKSHTALVIGGALQSAKDGVCPILEYDRY